MPDLVRVVSPDTEAELALVAEMLEAHGIPCFVRDARLGWVSGGMHEYVRNPRIVMVPGTRVAEATGLIQHLKSSRAASEDVARKHLSSQLRALVRFIWFGWSRPVPRNFK
jgi:hypothetical protein